MKLMNIVRWLLMGTCFFCIGAQQEVAISKLFYHQGNLGDKLVCYVIGNPICNRLPQRTLEKGRVQEVFFMPQAQLSSEAVSAVKKIMGAHHAIYDIAVAEVSSPMKGVKIAFEFDPQKIAIDYAGFDAISQKRGIVFSVHDKARLQEMNVRTSPLLQLAMGKKKPTIIVDCGHGGHDSGKKGCFGIEEKNITLQVGSKLAHRLQTEGYDVALTRDADYYVGLDERTAVANKMHGDLLISLHANGASRQEACGLETWCLKPDLFSYPVTDLQPSHEALNHRARLSSQSLLAAQEVHGTVLQHAQSHYDLKCRSIKHSVAQVLLGVEMPAVLLELGFLSNPKDALHLQNEAYQKQLVDGICTGIESYFKKSL